MLPFRLFFQRKRSEIVIDVTKFKPCEGKVIEVWNRRLLRTEMLFISVLTGKSELRRWATDFGSGSTLEREASLEAVDSKGRMHMRKQNI